MPCRLPILPPLGRALAVSVAAHLLLALGALHHRPPERNPPGPLKAVLGSPAGPPNRSDPLAAGPGRSDPPPRPSRVDRQRVAGHMPAPASPSPIEAGAPASPPAVSPLPAAAGDGGVAAALAAPSDGLSADGLRQYRLALAREARSFRPSAPNGRVGRVDVEVAAGASALPGTALARSSGDDALDRAAMEMVARAVRRAALPDSLRGRDFRLVLAVEFAAAD